MKLLGLVVPQNEGSQAVEVYINWLLRLYKKATKKVNDKHLKARQAIDLDLDNSLSAQFCPALFCCSFVVMCLCIRKWVVDTHSVVISEIGKLFFPIYLCYINLIKCKNQLL